MSDNAIDERDPDEYVAIGAITKPHGVRGEMRVHSFNAESTLWKKLESVRVVSGEGPRDHKVLRSKQAAKYVILSLEGVESMEAVDSLRRAEIHVPRAVLPPVREDEFYYADLPGMRVVDEEGALLGEALAVLEYPAVDCVEVRGSDGGIRELPLTRPWLRDVDESARQITARDWDDLPVRSG